MNDEERDTKQMRGVLAALVMPHYLTLYPTEYSLAWEPSSHKTREQWSAAQAVKAAAALLAELDKET